MKSIILSIICLYLLSCTKAKDVLGEPHCWRCETELTITYSGQNSFGTTAADYCGYTDTQIRSIEQAGTYIRTTSQSGITVTEKAITKCRLK